MKRIKKPAFDLLLTLLGFGLAGCSTPPIVQPLSNGYVEVTHPQRSMISSDELRVSFEYRGPDGKTVLIWPSLYGAGEIIHGDVAIFVGDKAYVSSNPDDPRGTRPRLFAVQAPGLPLDITDEVLWYWSKASGKDFAKAEQQFNLAIPTATNNQLELQLEFWMGGNGWPDNATLQLDWNQVSDMMRAVKEKGDGAQGFAMGNALHRELILAFENDRSGVSAERRKLGKIEECGLLPKATPPVLLRSQNDLDWPELTRNRPVRISRHYGFQIKR